MDSLYCHDVDQHERQPRQQERRHHESGDQEPLSPRSSVGSVKPDSTASSAPSSHAEYLMPPPSHHQQNTHHQHHQPQLHIVQHHLPSFSEMEAAARKRSEEAENDEHMLSQSPTRRPAQALGLNLMTYPAQQPAYSSHQQTQFIEVTQDSRGRFSSGGSTDSSSSARMGTEGPLRSLALLQSGYEHEGIHVERPPSELSINSGPGHFLSMGPDTPTSLDYHTNHHHHAGPPPTPIPRHYSQEESPHQHTPHHQPQSVGPVGHQPPPLPAAPEMGHHGKPSYPAQLHHHDSNHDHGHHHQHNQTNSSDPKRVKREQARNYVRQKRLEIQQNDPEKYEQLKEKNRLRRREKLKEIREDPVRYEEMKRKQRERVKEQRERIKQNPEAYEEMKRKQREREKARRREIMSDPATAAAWRERHRVMARERRLKRKIMYHLSDMSRQAGVSPDIKLETPLHGHEHDDLDDDDDHDHDLNHDMHVHLHERDLERERELDHEHEQMHVHHRHQHHGHVPQHDPPMLPPRHHIEEDRYIPVEPNDALHHQHHHAHVHHPEPEHMGSHHLEPIPSADTPLPPPQPPASTSGITPQQALTALIQSSEPIQEQINKYFAELKRSSEKRTDLILQLGLRKRQDSNKKRRGGSRGKRQASSPQGASGFSPSCLDESGVLFKTAAGENIGLKMEDDWGPIGSNDDSQASSDDFNTSGGSGSAGVVMVEHGGYAVHSTQNTGTNADMLFGGISPPPSPGMGSMGPPSDLSLSNLNSRSGHHMHHSGGITLVDEHGTHLHPHQVLPPQPAHHHHQHHHAPHAHHPSASVPTHHHGHPQHLYAPPPPSAMGGSMQEDLCQMPEDHPNMLHHVNPPQEHHHLHPDEQYVHHHPHQVHHNHGHSQQHLHHVHHMGPPPGVKAEGPQLSPCRQIILDPQGDQRRGFASSVSPETVVMDCSQQRLNSTNIYESYRSAEPVETADDTGMPTGSYIIATRESDPHIHPEKLEPGVKEEFSETSSTAGASPTRQDSPLPSMTPPSAPVAVDMSYLPKMGP